MDWTKKFVSRHKFFLIALIIVLAFVWSQRTDTSALIGQSMPDLSPEMRQQLASQGIHDIENKKIFMIFFATWCGICRLEAPVVNRLYRRLHPLHSEQEEVAEQGVDHKNEDWLLVATSEEENSKIQKFIQEKEILYPIVQDSGGALHDFFRVRGFPTKVKVGADGKIEDVTTGFNPLIAYTVFYWLTGSFFSH